jgi:hypothetical protein
MPRAPPVTMATLPQRGFGCIGCISCIVCFGCRSSDSSANTKVAIIPISYRSVSLLLNSKANVETLLLTALQKHARQKMFNSVANQSATNVTTFA